MPRRAAATRRETAPDPVYNNRLVTQLMNKVMLDGKKSTAEKIVYDAFDLIEEKTGSDPLATFKKAMDNVRPTLGGQAQACRWCDVPGAHRGQLPPFDHARDPLDRRIRA